MMLSKIILAAMVWSIPAVRSLNCGNLDASGDLIDDECSTFCPARDLGCCPPGPGPYLEPVSVEFIDNENDLTCRVNCCYAAPGTLSWWMSWFGSSSRSLFVPKTPAPTVTTLSPTTEPTPTPTPSPTPTPTKNPTDGPTISPEPVMDPTPNPVMAPTLNPTIAMAPTKSSKSNKSFEKGSKASRSEGGKKASKSVKSKAERKRRLRDLLRH